jgi:hypothetical protein
VSAADRYELANRTLEEAVAGKAVAALRADLGVVGTILTAGQLRGTSGAALLQLVVELLTGVQPATKTYLEHGAELGRRLGRNQAAEKGAPTEAIVDETLDALIGNADHRLTVRLAEAIKLARALPMRTPDDLLAVLAKARSAILSAEQTAGWVVHRSIALGHMEVAKAAGLNVVWLAERNACPACLAYQGHVAAPGTAFPAGQAPRATPAPALPVPGADHRPGGQLPGPPPGP